MTFKCFCRVNTPISVLNDIKSVSHIYSQDWFHYSEVLQNTHTHVTNSCDLVNFSDDINEEIVDKEKEKQSLKINGVGIFS